jgi:hypothetical protein
MLRDIWDMFCLAVGDWWDARYETPIRKDFNGC